MVRRRKPPEGHHAFYDLRQAHEMRAPGQHPDRRGASRGVWLARSMETERGPGTPPRLRRIAEHRRERFQLARRRRAAPWSCDKMRHIPRRTRANEAELLIA